jgi:D-alanyl-lipoteichoic acid acyltransferase DltB (MBOAT superfamily)
MVFSSSIFLFFFLPLVIAGYYLFKGNYRLCFLLLANLFFYAWGEPRYVLIMLLSIAINYGFGLLIYTSIYSKGNPCKTYAYSRRYLQYWHSFLL